MSFLSPKVPVASAVVKCAAMDRGSETIATRMNRLSNPAQPEMVLIGVSTGGPAVFAQLLPAIPGNLGVPILVVQHMPPIFTKSLADSLAPKCALRIMEATHGEFPKPDCVYIAPGGRQMRLGAGQEGRPILEMTDDPPENNCRPAVDYLFRSVAMRLPGARDGRYSYRDGQRRNAWLAPPKTTAAS